MGYPLCTGRHLDEETAKPSTKNLSGETNPAKTASPGFPYRFVYDPGATLPQKSKPKNALKNPTTVVTDSTFIIMVERLTQKDDE